MSRYRQDAGREGEDQAVAHLESLGYVVLERNFRNRGGEIDIVAQDNETTVFVEVKSLREGLWQEGAAANVTPVKQQKIVRTARAWLARLGKEVYCRFDVVTVSPGADTRIEHLKGAFFAR